MAIVNGLISLSDAKASLGITSTTYDADIEKYVEAATPVVENITGPMVSSTRTYVLDGGGGSIVVAPFTSVVSVVENGVTLTGVVGDGPSGVIRVGTSTYSRPFAGGLANVTVTVAVGLPAVPANVQLATRELVRFWWQMGRQGNRPAFGNDGVSDVDVPSGFAVPRRVIELLEASRRMDGFA